ncbi:MAG: hypothetical protein IT356_09055 [Gemmatimonadaceae bacterium]|nr:hypothetical protein [Gemmatimonadaceae bacterium]
MHKCHRSPAVAIVLSLCLLPLASREARAQDAGPLALLLPKGARAASMGNAWVAGRDEYAIFHNPAQVSASSGFGLTAALFAVDARAVSLASASAVGPVTLGWGVQFVDFSMPRTNTAYPFKPDALTERGDASLFSLVAVAAGQSTYKDFRIGVAAKYAEDAAPRETSASGLLVTPARGSAFLADAGVSHALWTGTAGLAVQNIAHPYRLGADRFAVPTQAVLGWAAQKPLGPLDVALATQLIARRGGWLGAGGGIEVGWSWIEGYNIAGRVGARRTESPGERPVGLGFGFTADRLNVDYGVNLFEGNTAAHYVTVRWR